MPSLLLLKLTTLMMGQTNSILPYFCLIKRLFSCFHENVGHKNVERKECIINNNNLENIGGKLQCNHLILFFLVLKKKRIIKSVLEFLGNIVRQLFYLLVNSFYKPHCTSLIWNCCLTNKKRTMVFSPTNNFTRISCSTGNSTDRYPIFPVTPHNMTPS